MINYFLINNRHKCFSFTYGTSGCKTSLKRNCLPLSLYSFWRKKEERERVRKRKRKRERGKERKSERKEEWKKKQKKESKKASKQERD